MIHLYSGKKKAFFDLFIKGSYGFFCNGGAFLSTVSVERTIDTPKVFDFLLKKHKFSPETVQKVAWNLSSLRKPSDSDKVLSFLRKNGFSIPQIEKMVKYKPQFLTCSLERVMKPKLNIFREFGYSADELAALVSDNPWILNKAMEKINSSLALLKEIVQSHAAVAELLRSSGWFLTTDLNKSLVPNIEFLQSCGVTLDQLRSMIYHFPRFFLCSPQHLRESVRRADELGMKRSSKIFLHGVRVIASMTKEKWDLKWQTLLEVGFSKDDILKAFRQYPVVFAVSPEKMLKVKEVVLATGRYDASCICKDPKSLGCSIEKWHKPRYRVLGILESKGVIKRWPNYTTLCRQSNLKFYEAYIERHFGEDEMHLVSEFDQFWKQSKNV